ncbi:hypothetical protein NPIL_570461 [Nephila pilipes]|uniref:Uncharacterized protein n=1 Tax=Nephila pilipes TaxID=299642 RepID=A0A8X6JT81_NEPPI|nr:hypothetical protein NPIL_570461 [Nephila pilipes]
MSSLIERTKEKPWRDDILNLPDCLGSTGLVAFRLTTAHDCLYAHLCRFWIVDSPACSLCCTGAQMNADHLPVYSSLTKYCIYFRYWEARDSL